MTGRFRAAKQTAAGRAGDGTVGLEDAPGGVDPIRELFEQDLLRTRLVVVLRHRFGRGGRRHRA